MGEEKNLNSFSSNHHMIGGDGPNSYALNSAYQKELLVSAENLVQELIFKHLDAGSPGFDPHNAFRIADLGCSVGPNAFFAVENIIRTVEGRYKSDGDDHRIPEFHVFFNDLVGNDFNTLFKLLPASRNYFAAAAPGSFHARIFPESSIHFAHCSTALHWLSRIPEGVTERSSKGWNEGRIHYSGARKEVKDTYSSQYKRDMNAFLSARGQELVPGGMMVLVLIGFPDDYVLGPDSSIGEAFDILGSCLYDMAKTGKIGEEEVDSFNLPFYYPTPSELEDLIEANGMFHMERMAELGAPMRRDPDPRSVVSHMRAVIGVLIEERFGRGIVDEVFELHLEKVLKRPIVDERHQKEKNYFVFLTRNG